MSLHRLIIKKYLVALSDHFCFLGLMIQQDAEAE